MGADAQEIAGRPTILSDELAMQICSQIAEGLSVREICSPETMPARGTVMRWVLEDRDGFRDKYAHAKELAAENFADELTDISDDGSNDWMERHNSKGEMVGWMENGEAVSRSRLRVDARKWVISKLLPKKYGEKNQMEVSGPGGAPIQSEHRIVFVDAQK